MKNSHILLLAACMTFLVLPVQVHADMMDYDDTTNDSAPGATADAGTSSSSVTTSLISSRGAALTGPLGQSSGDEPLGIGAWANGGGQYLTNSKAGHNYDGGLMLAIVGMDKVYGSLLVGVALGHEKLDLSTKYNGGRMRYDGYSVIPYLNYAITQELLVDVSFSYTLLDYTMKDTQAGVGYRDTMSADRQVTTLGLTRYLTLDKLLLSGRVGTLYLNEHQGSYRLNARSYTTAGIYTWQGSLGGRATYDLGACKPFLGLTYMQDFSRSGGTTNGMWGADLDLGLNHSLADALSLGLTGTFGLREDMTKVGGLLNITYSY
ncbi:MAG: autotransporter outer membrane beta-barrel domain-containing protein [Proteobacteria bacterium]|nr:autotransporter outer membrane beta-barrel domain-containing protein [Pseudomonadota bacterium]MBU1595032.1 autotransporter outer membrane beta-barrel domain-containing protein [Pseudomonadota bacterium]